MVMGVNENRVLCELQTNRKTNCNEMDTVRRGFKAMRELQDYVDAQAGGPGKGFFQIVTNPYEARRVDQPGPDGGGARDRDLRAVRLREPRGRRRATRRRSTASSTRCTSSACARSLLLNKFDNPLTGVRFDSGADGRADQRRQQGSAGSYWSARPARASSPTTRSSARRAEAAPAFNALLAPAGMPAGTAPDLSARAALQHARADRRSASTSCAG